MSGAPLAPAQDGYPSSINTHACLGYSVLGYQRSELARTSCDGGRSSKGHAGAKKEPDRRDKVAVAHAAVPLPVSLFLFLRPGVPRCSDGPGNATVGVTRAAWRPQFSGAPL